MLPKFDQLNLAVDLHHPHVICIVETWLCNDILDNELFISGYQLFRFDRNRHGGGILMYVNNTFTVQFNPSPPFPLELMSLSIIVMYLFMYVCFTALQALKVLFLTFYVRTYNPLMLFISLILYVLVTLMLILTMNLIHYFLIYLPFLLYFVYPKLFMALPTHTITAPCQLLI